jgi:acid phosphatase
MADTQSNRTKTAIRFARAVAFLACVALAGFIETATPLRAQPANVAAAQDAFTSAKRAARTYYFTQDYFHDIAAVAAEAEQYLLQRKDQVSKPALVLDIDETALSNWAELDANDFVYYGAPKTPCEIVDTTPQPPCGSFAWDRQELAPAIVPILNLSQTAQKNGVAVFFVTGRPVTEQKFTEDHLRKLGYPLSNPVALRPKDSTGPVAVYKAGERARIEQSGYTIIVNIGDQVSDLAGGHAERGFLLPNPFYLIP